MIRSSLGGVSAGLLVLLAACSANDSSGSELGGPAGSGAASSGGAGQGGNGQSGNGQGGLIGPGGEGDADFDGFSPADGDCNDSDSNANPAAFDLPGNGVDEDCNGTVDDEPSGCDGAIPDPGYADPFAAAQAIGLCRRAEGDSWGVIDARYTLADGTGIPASAGHGILQNFGSGVSAQEGSKLLVLSSGTARTPGMAGYREPVTQGGPFPGLDGGADMGTSGNTPPGFPIDSPSCPGVNTSSDKNANDPVALELTIKAPSNANSFSFNFSFYTSEYPNYVCQTFNDFFVALQDPPPASAQQGNISFDAQGNPVSVNNGFLEVCAPGNAGGKSFSCPQGTSALQGTGYESSAATGWLETISPVAPGQTITLRFAVWDMGDHILDSSVVIDNFVWSVDPASNPVTRPVPK